MIYLAKEHLLTMFTVCFLSSLTRSALRGPRRCCLLRKTVPLVPHKFPISLVSHQIFYPPDSNHIVNIFPTSSSPLSCIRFIRIKSTWYRRAHQCARSQCQPLAQYSTGNYSTPTFSVTKSSFFTIFPLGHAGTIDQPHRDLNPCKRHPPGLKHCTYP